MDFNFALFETKRNNYYITLPGSLSPTPDGKDRTRGAELDLTARPLRGLSLNANFVVQDPETLSNTLASNTILGVVNRSISGTLPSGVAKRSGRLWAAYEFQEPALRGWGVGLGAIYKGPSYADNQKHKLSGSLPESDTPSLLGLAASAPYFHDGSAPTLEALLRDRGSVHGMAETSKLTDLQVADLTAFLETL